MSKETLTSTFTELRKGFLRLAMRFLPNKEDADDALQEAFFRLWKHADQIGTTRRSWSAYGSNGKKPVYRHITQTESPAYRRAGREP